MENSEIQNVQAEQLWSKGVGGIREAPPTESLPPLPQPLETQGTVPAN